jgi:cytochrome oxidase Cu insertion factor (SCO1/SenC/PrrC family)
MSEVEQMTPQQIQPQGRSKKTFYLLALVFVLPFTLAATLHLLNLKPSGKSYGNLVQPPKSLTIPMLHAVQGKEFKPQQWQKIWSVVMLDDGLCAAPCQAQVHMLKQVHTSLNKEIKRVQRVVLVPATIKPEVFNALQKQYPDLIVLAGADEATTKFSAEFKVANANVYLVDPLGNLMMSYPEKFDPKGLRSDLSRLLRNSWAG